MAEKYPFDHVSPVWSRYSDMVVSHGAGSYLYDTEGNKYLDFTTGIGAPVSGKHRADFGAEPEANRR